MAESENMALNILVNLNELKEYYNAKIKEEQWKNSLPPDINWHLSFAQYKEFERTKHVHRLHPYKGKFIPQLVEYFLDSHIDEFKKEVYFQKEDIILDPFCGSGTTLVQANELGIHAIGVDISIFNTLISNVKIQKHNLNLLRQTIEELNFKLKVFQKNENNVLFEEILLNELSKFNNQYFPSPDYKRKVSIGLINENEYAKEKEKDFLLIFNALIKEYQIKVKQSNNKSFLDRWFLYSVRKEIDFLSEEIEKIKNTDVNNVLKIILSRTVRSCRATTHADLATLKEPVITTYYCKKHGKICKPIFSISKWWEYYTQDTLKRLEQFEKLRTNTFQICLNGDSRTINIFEKILKIDKNFWQILQLKK